jgi:hypothetical protein
MGIIRGIGYFMVACVLATVVFLVASASAVIGIILFLILAIFVISYMAKEVSQELSR